MSENNEISRKANRRFFAKIRFSALLIILGAVAVSLILHDVQNASTQNRMRLNNEQTLQETVKRLTEFDAERKMMTAAFHEQYQQMADSLAAIVLNGSREEFIDNEVSERSEYWYDICERTGISSGGIIDALILNGDGRIMNSLYPEDISMTMAGAELLNTADMQRLLKGTMHESVSPVYSGEDYGERYYYSASLNETGTNYMLAVSTPSSILDLLLEDSRDISSALDTINPGRDSLLYTIDTRDGKIRYFGSKDSELTGMKALEAGFSEASLTDGTSSMLKIGDTEYYCTSRKYDSYTIVGVAFPAANVKIYDRLVLSCSDTVFTVIMLLCLIYAVIVRNDFVRHSIKTDKKVIAKKKEGNVYFDLSVFKRVLPLMLIGVLAVFGISFYTQSMLEISDAMADLDSAVSILTERVSDIGTERGLITSFSEGVIRTKAKLMAVYLEENPDLLNEQSLHIHSGYTDKNERYLIYDEEGNPLKSIPSSKELMNLSGMNQLFGLKIYNSTGRVIASTDEDWYLCLPYDAEDSDYPFREVTDGKKDFFLQDAVTDENGYESQRAGVMMHTYTSLDENGNTVYVSRKDYEDSLLPESVTEVHPHTAMLQLDLDPDRLHTLMMSTDSSRILTPEMLREGSISLFDNSSDHICLYSPREADISRTADELGIPANAFGTVPYYGFQNIDATGYLTHYVFSDHQYLSTAIPRSQIYASRMRISFITAAASLIMILLLSCMITITSEEEEHLYENVSPDEQISRFNSAIFNIILPSGRSAATVKAAARWNNRSIPWSDRTPEQKLVRLIAAALGILMLYAMTIIIGSRHFLGEIPLLRYILSRRWDRGPNLFACSYCVLVIFMIILLLQILRVLLRMSASLFGARGETVSHLLMSVIKYGGTIGTIFYSLYQIGVDSPSLLASAGVLTLIIGLGAQSLIKDIIAGIFIVFEGEFRVGDIVTIGGYRGTVVDIGLRTTKVSGVGGNIKIFNNSDVADVINMTKQASTASCTMCIDYGQDIAYVEEVLAKELPLIKEKYPEIVEGPTYLGVSELSDSCIKLLIICKCAEPDVWSVGRILNRELLLIFNRYGINIPYPHMTVVPKEENKD